MLFDKIELFEAVDLPPRQRKTAVVVVGRFNPVHKGHSKIVGVAQKAWSKYKYDAVIVVVVAGKQTGKDKSRNPLSASSRIKYLKQTAFGNGVIFIEASNAFDAFVKVRKHGYEPMAVVGGKLPDEDRGQKYKEILDKYFTNDDETPIEHVGISVERDESGDGVQGISASVMRAAAENGLMDDFIEWSGLPPSIGKKMYDEVRTAMGVEGE